MRSDGTMDHAARLCTGKENEERQNPNIALILSVVQRVTFCVPAVGSWSIAGSQFAP